MPCIQHHEHCMTYWAVSTSENWRSLTENLARVEAVWVSMEPNVRWHFEVLLWSSRSDVCKLLRFTHNLKILVVGIKISLPIVKWFCCLSFFLKGYVWMYISLHKPSLTEVDSLFFLPSHCFHKVGTWATSFTVMHWIFFTQPPLIITSNWTCPFDCDV